MFLPQFLINSNSKLIIMCNYLMTLPPANFGQIKFTTNEEWELFFFYLGQRGTGRLSEPLKKDNFAMHCFFVEQLDENTRLGTKKLVSIIYISINLGKSLNFNSTKCKSGELLCFPLSLTTQNYDISTRFIDLVKLSWIKIIGHTWWYLYLEKIRLTTDLTTKI